MAIEHVFATVATSTNFVSPWVPLNINADSFSYTAVIKKVGTQGQINAVVQTTLDNVLEAGVSANTVTLSTFSAQIAEGTSISSINPVRAIRVVVSASVSSGFSFRVLQTGV